MSDPRQVILRLPSGLHVRLQLLGSGPAVLMLHESPRSSNALLPLAGRLAARFTCIMMDTPGFGYSDPLPLARPEIADYAQVALEVTNALGLGRIPFYGTHTGAAIAVEAALIAPDRVSAAVLDGYALFDAAERDELLASYLPPLRPSLDGSHVAWLWARVRDQFTAFPWNRVGDGSRLPYGPPPLASINAVVDDFLRAGDHYRAAYAAAFRYDHLEPLRHVAVPMRLATRVDDLLFKHMERARDANDLVTLTEMSADRDAWGVTIGNLISDHVDGDTTSASQIMDQIADTPGDRWIGATDIGPVLVSADGAGEPIVLLHDLPGDRTDLDHEAARLARGRRVIRPDIPGLGGLNGNRGVFPTLDQITDATAAALGGQIDDDTPIVAFGAAVAIAARWAGGNPLIAVDPWPAVNGDCSAEVPDLTPRWDGTHLVSAFWWARDQAVYKPWFRRDNARGRPIGNERDTERIHNRFRAMALAGPAGGNIAKTLYRHDTTGDLQRVADRLSLIVNAGDPDHDAQAEWIAQLGQGPRVEAVSQGVWPLVRAITDLCR